MEKDNKIMFILKKRTIYSDAKYTTVNSGLYNSAKFVNDMLCEEGIESNLVEVVDNNEIDKFVTKYRPDIVIIEAVWVVPSKFEILKKLHPNVKWYIRIHSELPFIANEGVAIEWLKAYSQYDNVFVSANSNDFIKSMEPILGKDIIYTPNYYPVKKTIPTTKPYCPPYILNVGLFGAIRPMKNTLTQAVAAMIYADRHNQLLRLHINTERIEQKGDSALKNVRALFAGTKHELVEHKWLKHSEFVELVSHMDIGLQVSLTETYNIVTADFVSQSIPVVTSKEITFVNCFNTSDTTKDAVVIADKIETALTYKFPLTNINKFLLKNDSNRARLVWLDFVS